MRRALLCAILVACSSRTAPATLSVSIGALRQALGGVDLSTATSAQILGSCGDGTAVQTNAVAITASEIDFAEVPACGGATLTLTIAVGGVDAFIGTASATLSPGQVTIDFAGSLYGEIDFSADAAWTCQLATPTAATQTVVLLDDEVGVSLKVGSYAVTCAGPEGNFSDEVSVSLGAITTETVTAAVVTPPAPPDSSLQSLVITPGIFTTPFSPTVLDPSFTAARSATALDVAAVPTDPNATVTVNGASQTSVAFSGANLDVSIVVTSGSAQTTYVVHVSRSALNDDATLSMPFFSFFNVPNFSPTVLDYAASVANGVTAIQVTVNPNDSGASLTVDGAPYPGGDGESVPVSPGLNQIVVVVTAADGFTQLTYIFSVTVAPPDSALADMFLQPGTLVPAFSPTVTDYTALFASAHDALSIGAILFEDDGGATVTLDGGDIFSSVNLPLGPSTHQVTVNNGGAITTYTLHCVRGLVSNIAAAGLAAFSSAQYRYDLQSKNDFNVTVTSSDATVQLLVNDGVASSGVANLITVPVGPSTIRIDAVSNAEVDSYWIRNVNGSLVSRLAIEANNVAVSTATIDTSDTPSAPSGASNEWIYPATSIDVDPTGTLLFASLTGGIQSYLIDGMQGGQFVAGSPLALAASPRGKFIVTIDSAELVNIYSYDNSGNLTFVESSSGGGSLTSLAVEPSGRFFYVAGSPSFIEPIALNGDGSLEFSTVQSGIGAVAMCADPTGAFLFALDGANLQRFAISALDGTLSNPTQGPATTASSIACGPGLVYYNDGVHLSVVDTVNMVSAGTPVASDTPALAASPAGDPRVFTYDAGSLQSYSADLSQNASASAMSSATLLKVIEFYNTPDAHFSYLASTDAQLYPPFSVSTLDYTLLLSAERASETFSGTTIDPSATFSVDGGGATTSVPFGASEHEVVVSNGKSQTTYTVLIQRGLIGSITSQTAGFPAFDPSLLVPRLDLAINTNYDFTVTTTDLSVALAVDDSGVVPGAQQLELPPSVGVSIVRIDATTPDGEKEGYWIRNVSPSGILGRSVVEASATAVAEAALNADDSLGGASGPVTFAGTTTNAIAIDPTQALLFSTSNAGLQSMTLGSFASHGSIAGAFAGLAANPRGKFIAAFDSGGVNMYAYAPAGGLSDIGLGFGASSAPLALAADPLGRFLFVGDASEIHTRRWYGDGSAGADVVLGAGVGASALCVDPTGGLLYAVDGTNLYRFVISAVDGSLSSMSEVAAAGATAVTCSPYEIYWSTASGASYADPTTLAPGTASVSTTNNAVAVPPFGDLHPRVLYYTSGSLESSAIDFSGTGLLSPALTGAILMLVYDQY